MPLKMLHPDKALEIVTATAREQAAQYPSAEETVGIDAALGRSLIREMISPIDHPPFDKAAMDGYAFDSKTAADTFEVVELVPAGRTGLHKVAPGTAARIMTGAPIPEGADVVQRFEWTEALAPAGGEAEVGGALDLPRLVKFTKKETSTNIIKRGENLLSGGMLLGPRVLAPQDIGILAAAGYAEVPVAKRPKVGVVSTGNEVSAPGSKLDSASIYDSNGYQTSAQARAFGAEVKYYGIVRDDEAALRDVFARALSESELVIASGGVSMGDFDLVPKVLEALGVETVFHSIAMRPGKPTYFGVRGGCAVFGLPGNPVSSFVNFDFLIKAYLAARRGGEYRPRVIRARLKGPLLRKDVDRVEFLPLRVTKEDEGMFAEPIRYRGSSMITALAETDGFARVEIGVDRVDAGVAIDVRLVRA